MAKKKPLPPDVQAKSLIKTLIELRASQQLGPYITHIRFPRFKNLARNARIDFHFPVTALVGPNGCGKTSALHALYGAPDRMSTSDYWFATDLDPIKEGEGEPNRFVYGHILAGQPQPVETRKARVGKSRKRRPGYFEPTKAVVGDSMDLSPFPTESPVTGQSKDRWNPVQRKVLYINFRSELSAFDKFLYFGRPRRTKTLRSKQDRLQLGAKRVSRVLQSGEDDTELYGKRVVFKNRTLDAKELSAVCWILGKSYRAAHVVEHRYYGSEPGLTVRFETDPATYSDAYAGSGELAITSLVVQVMGAEKHSLVLLDEPEVSIHPGAQERLLLFLLQQAVAKKHQIVFTTHAPGLIGRLPPEAIKVFFQAEDGRFDVVNNAHPYAAFHRLGAIVPGNIRVLVEDKLAKNLVDLACHRLSDDAKSLIETDFLPGGSKNYYSHRVATLMHETKHTYLFLDGDQRPTTAFPDPSTIPVAENATLRGRIKEATGTDVSFGANGGDDPQTEDNLYAQQRRYLEFLCKKVRFLPRSCPEEVVVRAISDVTPESSRDAKNALAAIVQKKTGRSASFDIDAFAWASLSQIEENEDMDMIMRELQGLVDNFTP